MNKYGQFDIFDYISEPVTIKKPIRLIELFAGYGSQAMALKRIGAKFEHYRVVEFDKYAIASYNAVHGTDFPTMDITKVHAEDLNICDTETFTYLLTYSFPCTDLSVAGKQAGMSKGSGTRSGLLWEVERILTEIRDSNGELPQILFMENVPQVHGKKNINDFEKWLEFLESLGYTNYWQDLNAKNYGIAQNRERCFMFSFLGEYNYHFPEPTPLTKHLKDCLEDNVDEKYYLNNEKAQKLIQTLIDNGTLPDTIPSRAEQRLEVNMQGTSNCLTSVQKDNLLLEKPLLLGGIGKENEFGSQYRQGNRVYSSDACAMALNSQPVGNAGGNSYLYNVGYRIRKLTPRECGRLMGVPDEDIDKMAAVNSNTQLYKQFGNSIVVDVMCAMFKNLNINQK